MERLSPHITMAEAVHSNTAKRLGIENKPNPEQIASMLTIAEMIFEPLRVFVGGPIKINSFFRSPALNKAVGGATKNGKPTSQHCKGEAMDLDDVYGHASNAQMFDWIRANLDFDQMIWEFGTDENPAWIHVSYVDAQENRNRCLKAYKTNGKTKYKVI